MLTTQEVFDKVALHLLTQNERSENPEYRQAGWGCKYRFIKDGRQLMCAVGCLISDEAYSQSLENKAVMSIDVKNALRASGVEAIDENEIMLVQLQRLHDTGSPEFWKELLLSVAYNWGLSTKAVDDFKRTE